LIEYEGSKEMIIKSGVEVIEFLSTNPDTPDAVFPDWFTIHRNSDIPEGLFILYPMKHHSR
jgi:hypothetical protein